MAQFTLVWDNSDIVNNTNADKQRLLYRYKGQTDFVSVGFTPTNDVDKTIIKADSPALDNNKVVQFKVQCTCIEGGPSDNDNGIKEIMGFACILPNIASTENQSTVSIDTTGLDITKVRFQLRKSTDNTLVGSAIVANVVSNIASTTKTGLLSDTNYYWQIELYGNINNTEVISSSTDFLGTLCSPYPFKTAVPATCNPITSLTVNSIEIA